MTGSRRGACALCGQQRLLTFHHLIPKKMHRRKRFARTYSRSELAAGIELCRLCHKAIHRFHDEMTLARDLNTLEALQADPRIARHVGWAARQTGG